jgi:hypothetical protein
VTHTRRIAVSWNHIQTYADGSAVVDVVAIEPTIGRDRVVAVNCVVAGQSRFAAFWIRNGPVDLDEVACWLEALEEGLSRSALGVDSLVHATRARVS